MEEQRSTPFCSLNRSNTTPVPLWISWTQTQLGGGTCVFSHQCWQLQEYPHSKHLLLRTFITPSPTLRSPFTYITNDYRLSNDFDRFLLHSDPSAARQGEQMESYRNPLSSLQRQGGKTFSKGDSIGRHHLRTCTPPAAAVPDQKDHGWWNATAHHTHTHEPFRRSSR